MSMYTGTSNIYPLVERPGPTARNNYLDRVRHLASLDAVCMYIRGRSRRSGP